MPLAMMKKVPMVRFQSNQFGTFSLLTLPSGNTLTMGELPWVSNMANLSCIPCGEYVCRPINSHNFGKCYSVDGVEGRTHILIHAANFCGDRRKPKLKSDLKGCIAPGKRIGTLSVTNNGSQIAVLSSGDALNELFKEMNNEKFLLEITGVVG